MSIRYLELAGSADLLPTLEKIENNQTLDFAEYRLLQDSANAKLDQLLRKCEHPEDLEQLRLTSVRMAHLLQSSCLALRRLDLAPRDKRLAREALAAQLAYMQACLQRSLINFD
ncbi:hypothetical protein [Pseudomonas cremoricolorata]|uniref:hypothetical protein n=1 Tax=Pseudomonas cremoricolorata TaxID=157783 RepID=UPI000421DB03|nr:hypothetical protein [Pseudomonas cremoricolorata]